MDSAPTWVVAIGLAALFVLSLAIGSRLYPLLRGDLPDNGRATGAGYILAASLGLLSLLISFTLAMSLDRYEIRRRLVVDEASAISTTWLRDQLLGQPFRGRLDSLLRDYVKERRELASVRVSPAAQANADERTRGLQQRIWQETVAGLGMPGASVLTTAVLQATNGMFDLPDAQRAALDAEVPPPVLWTLLTVAVLAALLTGYGLAAGGHRHRVASAGYFMAVALAMTLIFELDQPSSGLIQVPRTPLERAAQMMLTAPPPAD
jgi:hypothetical protein